MLNFMQLTERLTAHELVQSRSFSSLLKQIPKHTTASDGSNPTPQPSRSFNTSRELKAVGDTSTIDFAFIPDFDPDAELPAAIRVPILPQNYRDPTAAVVDADEAVSYSPGSVSYVSGG